jgi:hypothetical protein
MNSVINHVAKVAIAAQPKVITRDGHTFGDRSATVFCHVKALGRSGIATDELRAGTRLSFRTKPPRCDRDRDEAFDLVSLAA